MSDLPEITEDIPEEELEAEADHIYLVGEDGEVENEG